jgi:hypothetical protein
MCQVPKSNFAKKLPCNIIFCLGRIIGFKFGKYLLPFETLPLFDKSQSRHMPWLAVFLSVIASDVKLFIPLRLTLKYYIHVIFQSPRISAIRGENQNSSVCERAFNVRHIYLFSNLAWQAAKTLSSFSSLTEPVGSLSFALCGPFDANLCYLKCALVM